MYTVNTYRTMKTGKSPKNWYWEAVARRQLLGELKVKKEEIEKTKTVEGREMEWESNRERENAIISGIWEKLLSQLKETITYLPAYYGIEKWWKIDKIGRPAVLKIIILTSSKMSCLQRTANVKVNEDGTTEKGELPIN